ncbi:MAG: hypothetical protein AB1716_04025 [Planctomycetota bacterium]
MPQSPLPANASFSDRPHQFPRTRASAALSFMGVPRERRHEPRESKAFAFWIRRPNGRYISAWMLDMAPSSAAFLTATADAPPVGEAIELIEMQTADRLVREDAALLPRWARVLRHDPDDGVTKRVAVRLESRPSAPLSAPDKRVETIARPATKSRRTPPPMPALPGVQPLGALHASGIPVHACAR